MSLRADNSLMFTLILMNTTKKKVNQQSTEDPPPIRNQKMETFTTDKDELKMKTRRLDSESLADTLAPRAQLEN